jgi:metallo-beta-lactamase family protein
MSVRLHFHGAAGGVTGSCFRLETEAASVLVDCGLFQGPKTLKELNYRRFPFDPKAQDAMLLTHAHVDHSGLLPKLMLAGFKGPIHATAGTRDLCAVMLPDAGGIQEHEVEQLNRRLQRKGRRPVEPIYTAEDARDCMRQFSKVGYGDWIEPARGLRARWWDAGHILGSASIEVEVADAGSGAPLRLLFSGDLGPGHSDFSGDPEGPAGVDHLILESTYGKTERAPLSGDERRRRLADEVKAAHAAGGPLLIPAFAVERTQELIADLVQLMQDGAAPPSQIFLDSPLAVRAFDVFFRRGRDESGANPFAAIRGSGFFHTTESVDESKALERLKGWHIVIAASGMCDAGRIRHHLKRLLWREEVTVLLVGYQASGTLGRFLQEGQQRVRIQGEEIRVRAAVRSLDVYSGHADGPALTAWAQARAPIGGQVFLVHGEPDSREALKRRLTQAGIAEAMIAAPEMDECFRLDRAASRREAGAPPRLPPGASTELDWHNARSRLLLRLDEALEAAPDDAARAAVLDRLDQAMKTLERADT